MSTRIVTTGILAGAYMRRAPGAPRTHLVEVEPDAPGWPVKRVLCGRADPKNATDDSTQWTDDRPTCPVCAKKWDRMNDTRPRGLQHPG